MELESNRFHQGAGSVEGYVEEFMKLIGQSGLRDGRGGDDEVPTGAER